MYTGMYLYCKWRDDTVDTDTLTLGENKYCIIKMASKEEESPTSTSTGTLQPLR